MSTKKLYSTVNRIENAIKFRSLSLPPSVPIKAFVFKEATSKPKRGAQGWTASGKQKNKGIGNGNSIMESNNVCGDKCNDGRKNKTIFCRQKQALPQN